MAKILSRKKAVTTGAPEPAACDCPPEQPAAVDPEEAPGENEEAVPEAPENPEPQFADGQRVDSRDPRRRPGKIVGPAVRDNFAYTVKPDGEEEGDEFTETESALSLYSAEEGGEEENTNPPPEEPMPESKAPVFLSAEFGLAPGSTFQQCIDVHGAMKTERDDATSEAKTSALKFVGAAGDLVDILAGSLIRKDGESWVDAASAMKAARPSAFNIIAEGTPAGDGSDGSPESSSDSAETPEVPHQAPLGKGADGKVVQLNRNGSNAHAGGVTPKQARTDRHKTAQASAESRSMSNLGGSR